MKLIGDEAMFVVSDPLRLRARRRAGPLLAEDPQLPSVRIALAAGPVVSHHGDYYGDVVNLAARLVKAAQPGELLVSASRSRRPTGASRELSSKPPGRHALKGYDERVAAYRLIPPSL